MARPPLGVVRLPKPLERVEERSVPVSPPGLTLLLAFLALVLYGGSFVGVYAAGRARAETEAVFSAVQAMLDSSARLQAKVDSLTRDLGDVRQRYTDACRFRGARCGASVVAP